LLQQVADRSFRHASRVQWIFMPGSLIKDFRTDLNTTLEMIKFEHSVFALPFALTGAVLAARGWPSLRVTLWIVVAMVGARSAAMAFNRLADARWDALNPRTSNRALPAGALSRAFVIAFTVFSGALLVLAAWMLNPLCLALSPVALGVVCFYSYTKRFTSWSHLVLGFSLGIAPAAAWIAVRGSLDPAILLLTVAVMLWTAGFDIIYACQDVEFDQRAGLHSIPRYVGVSRALWISTAMHAVMMIPLLALALLMNLGWIALAGLAMVAVLLVYEHSLVKPGDLSRVNPAFFNVNAYISLLFFVTWSAAVFFP
jgi:4-hydroxybenzoate polyprenyltransferase